MRGIISKPELLGWIGWISVLCSGCSASTENAPPDLVEPESPPPADVLVVVLDTLRPDVLGSYGAAYGISPNFDAFAEQAVLFEDVTVSGSWTWPVHASLFTGEPPWVHGAHRSSEGEVDLGTLQVRTIRPETTTLARRLSDAGYATRSVSGNGLLRPELGLVRGFDEALVFDDRDDRVVEQALEWMQLDTPLFLFVNLLGSHLPYVEYDSPEVLEPETPLVDSGLAPWLGPHPLGSHALRLNRRLEGHTHGLVLEVARGERTLTDAELSVLARTYRSDVWGTDRRLGAVLDAWQERTNGRGIVVITSDHGEHFGELGLLDHGQVLNGVNTRVPLLIRAPGHEPLRVGSPVAQVDVHDTILGLLSLMDESAGLGPAMRGGSTPSDVILARSWVNPVWAQVVGGRHAYGQRLVRRGDWALLGSEDGSEMLYRISEDPLMLEDRSSQYPETVDRLRGFLSEADESSEDAAPLLPDDATRETLEALGYVEP